VGEYGAGGIADLKAEYIWTLPEVGMDAADDGTGGYTPLAVALGVAGGGASELQWVHANHLGTPILTTNASGSAVIPYGYAAIGFPGQFANALLLPGAEHYYNRYRDYDPTTGRYIQADPIGLAGDVNAWVYAGANPLVGVDPEGLETLDAGTVAWQQGAKHVRGQLLRPSRRIPIAGQLMVIGDTLGTLVGIAYYGYINPPRANISCNKRSVGVKPRLRSVPVVLNNYGEGDRCVDQWLAEYKRCEGYRTYRGASFTRYEIISACKNRADNRLSACKTGKPLPRLFTLKDM
jgi:RHS repeat-associated protein